MRVPTAAELVAALVAHGFVAHNEVGRLNVVLIRRVPGTLDAFDDMLVVLWHDKQGGRQVWACRCTADPGKPIQLRPKRKDGFAVWAVGQMVDGFQLGDHNPGMAGAYRCLRPVRPVPVLRYDGLNDRTGTPSTSANVQIHRANPHHESTVVSTWSEGCCVVPNPVDYGELMRLAEAQVAAGWPRFTVALIEQIT